MMYNTTKRTQKIVRQLVNNISIKVK